MITSKELQLYRHKTTTTAAAAQQQQKNLHSQNGQHHDKTALITESNILCDFFSRSLLLSAEKCYKLWQNQSITEHLNIGAGWLELSHTISTKVIINDERPRRLHE